jgi:hypothetical protein
VAPAVAADLDQWRQLVVIPDQHEHAGTPQGTQASLQPGERGEREENWNRRHQHALDDS